MGFLQEFFLFGKDPLFTAYCSSLRNVCVWGHSMVRTHTHTHTEAGACTNMCLCVSGGIVWFEL